MKLVDLVVLWQSLLLYERNLQFVCFRDKENLDCLCLFSANHLPQLASCSESTSLFELQSNNMKDITNKVIVLRSVKNEIIEVLAIWRIDFEYSE